MKRLIVLLSVLLLTGCPATFCALVENRSEENVEFISKTAGQQRDLVEPGEIEKVYIFPGCQLVKIGEFTGYLDFSKTPDEAWVSLDDDGRENQIEIIYTSGGFSVKTSSGKSFVIEVQESCYN